MKLVYIEWCDAVSNPKWFEAEEMKRWAKECDWVIREAGWLVEETKEYIVFATSWKPDDGWSGEQFCNIHKIPKTWIRKRKNLVV